MPHHRSPHARVRRLAISVALAVLASWLSIAAPPAQAATRTCRAVTLSVSLAPGGPTDQTVRGTLCDPVTWGTVHAVDVLVHGAGYNSSYWDSPIDPDRYSYVDDTLAAGRATMTYDAIGTGASSHPASTAVTPAAQAFVLHQVLDWLHGLGTYARFDVIGHSLGSITAVSEAATYHDENVLVLSGFTHAINPVHITIAAVGFYPADADPQFAGRGLDPGYLTTLPGSRATLFYSATADPAIVAYDEAHKDGVPGPYFLDGLVQAGIPVVNDSARVTVPMLEMIGEQDFLYCGTGALVDCASPGSVEAFDLLYFTAVPSLTVLTVPATGHDLALHPTSTQSFAEINGWLGSH